MRSSRISEIGVMVTGTSCQPGFLGISQIPQSPAQRHRAAGLSARPNSAELFENWPATYRPQVGPERSSSKKRRSSAAVLDNSATSPLERRRCCINLAGRKTGSSFFWALSSPSACRSVEPRCEISAAAQRKNIFYDKRRRRSCACPRPAYVLEEGPA